jgi:hypothetical protein
MQDKTAPPWSQAKLQKNNKYCRRKGLPKALKGAAGGGLPSRFTISVRSDEQLRPRPSLAPRPRLSRPDPDEARR